MLRFIIILYHDRQSMTINGQEPIRLGGFECFFYCIAIGSPGKVGYQFLDWTMGRELSEYVVYRTFNGCVQFCGPLNTRKTL